MATEIQTTIVEPTHTRYQCGSGCGTVTFRWTRRMPKGGWLGEVSIGRYVKKPIQVFKPLQNFGITDWTFQAQDGSFLGHLYVSLHKSYIAFANFRPGDDFPQTSCLLPTPIPGDARIPLDKLVNEGEK